MISPFWDECVALYKQLVVVAKGKNPQMAEEKPSNG